MLEVGLGGRLDATNVVDAPVAVVTGVALDHEAILGDTLAAIAREKAGIWKRGQRAIIGASGEPAAVPCSSRTRARPASRASTVIDDAAIAGVPPLALAGAHQRRNAAAALAADALAARGVCRSTARRARDGRASRAGSSAIGDVILDGAHNPHGARALAATLRELGDPAGAGRRGVADKDVARDRRARSRPTSRAIVATRYQQDRALAPDGARRDLRARSRRCRSRPRPISRSARRRAHRSARPILVAGSLFLVGEARVAAARCARGSDRGQRSGVRHS